ncbi:MAG: ABC transporter ATP-binding protein [Chloroflexi bacterium]|nr:ABC transporter ATP-binding protein [Chloroflexota bacterium]
MAVLWRLLAFVSPYRWRFTLAALCLLAGNLSAIAIPRLMGQAVDQVLGQGSLSGLLTLALLILGLSVLRGAFAYGQSYVGEWVSQRVAYDLRNAFYQKLQTLSFGYHDRQQTGDLMSKATADVEGVRWFLNMGTLRALQLLVLVIATSTILLLLNWRLGLIAMAFMPLVAWRAIAVSTSLRSVWLKIQALTGEMTTILQENLAGQRVVKAFAAEEYEQQKFNAKAGQLSQESLVAGQSQAANSAQMTFLFIVATGVILWYGAYEVSAGRLSPGGLSQFLFYLGLLAMPLRTTGWIINSFTRAASSGQRLFEVMDASSPVRERPGAVALGRVKGHVAFRNVSFSYDSSVEALTDISFEARPGQVLALVGPPGSGKTTIVHLLPRFYDVTSGAITVDGLDIRDVNLASLRQNVGIVLQDVFLFSSTIQENIAYGRPNATLEEIIQAGRRAQLHDFVTSLPQGYQTWVGERGITLSGGQRQRLAIARTLLLDPPILILDDSTSSLDTETERLLAQALAEVMRGRTVFVITHRLSMVKGADLVLVMKEGRIVERGNQQELLALGGVYAALHVLQQSGRQDSQATLADR